MRSSVQIRAPRCSQEHAVLTRSGRGDTRRPRSSSHPGRQGGPRRDASTTYRASCPTPRIILSACSTSRVSDLVLPICRSRRFRVTALTARQTAMLVRSTPSAGESSRSEWRSSARAGNEDDDDQLVLESRGDLVDRNDNRRAVLAGLPFLAAPSEVSQISPRRGSVGRHRRGPPPTHGPRSLPRRHRHPPARHLARDGRFPRWQRRERGRPTSQQGQATLICLAGQEVSSLTGHPDSGGLSRHAEAIVALWIGDVKRRSVQHLDGRTGALVQIPSS